MNNSSLEKDQNPTLFHLHRVGWKVYDKDWNEVKSYEHKGWRYLKIDGKQIGVSSLTDKTGYDEPVYFGYVFCGLFQNGANEYFDKLLCTRL